MNNRKRAPSDHSRHDELLQGTRPDADARLVRDILDAPEPGPRETDERPAAGGARSDVVVVRAAQRAEKNNN